MVNKKEYGSDFHYVDSILKQEKADLGPILQDSKFSFSGRTALYELVKLGIKEHDWKNIYIPDYYCHEVGKFVSNLGIAIRYFEDGPYQPFESWEDLDQKGNVIIWVNYFGIRNRLKKNFSHASLIEDHTHDPFSLAAIQSSADYCFASLRKTLPIPAGGIYWSPRRLPLPTIVKISAEAEKYAFMKLSGMLLKRLYLEGKKIEKNHFRNLFIQSEEAFEDNRTNSKLPLFIEEMVQKVSVKEVREKKNRNYQQLFNRIKNKNLIFWSSLNTIYCPIGMVLIFPDQFIKEEAKRYFIQHLVYPAVLWPNQVNGAAKEFANRMLMIHCDFRYTIEDMDAIALIINQNPSCKPL